MSYKLFLDDRRRAPEGWKRVRNYKEFCDEIKKELPVEISFDIELGELHSGFDCIKYLGALLKNKKLKTPIKIYCHSGSIFSLAIFVEDVLGENAIYMGRLENVK